jgi:3-isopropylmalate/(R)-2-methylmalate dehydratase large subunit
VSEPRTIFEKIWNRHVITTREDGADLLYIDRLLSQENTFHAFAKMRAEGHTVKSPSQVFCFADHYVPTEPDARAKGLDGIKNPEIRAMVEIITQDAEEFGIQLFGLGDIRQGVLHVVGPEQGISQPGMIIAGADSHTSTHGAVGAFAFGVGSSESAHVLATQALWRQKPNTMRVDVSGKLPFGVTSKDVILAIVGKVGAGGAVGHVIEYTGEAIRDMNVEQRMTVCNMSIEAGARAGLITPDEKVIEYVRGRPYAPKEEDFDTVAEWWRTLASDNSAAYDREVSLNARDITPMVTWGNSPEDVVAITDVVPDPEHEPDLLRRAKLERAIDYMDLIPGTPMTEIAVDKVFIGSCTNGRIEDFRAAAEVVKGRKTTVPSIAVPATGLVKKQAEEEGLDKILIEAGFEWREPGCSMCVGINGDDLRPGQRSASTTNRNFEGRQGRGSRTHLLSPTMAAAAAVTGHLTDVRKMQKGA